MDFELDITSAVQLLTHAAPAIQLMVFATMGLWLCINRVLAWIDGRSAKRQRDEEHAAKARRDAAFRELLTTVAAEVRANSVQSTQVAREAVERLEGLGHAVTTLQRTVQDVRDRQAQVISRTESLAIVASKFNDYVRNEAVAIFDQSLRRNAYAERREFVRERVKTVLGDAVGQARESLVRDYRALSVDLDPFFPERGGGEGGTRYTLIDRLWERVEPLYLGPAPVDERVEEMRVAVRNAVADHVTQAAASAADIYAATSHLATAEG